MPRKKMSEEEMENNRTAIRQVATNLFSKKGYDAVTMRSIATELDWSPMATYKYYESKDAIFKSVREEALTRLAETMQRSALDAKDPVEILYLQCRAYVRFGIENHHEYSLAFDYYTKNMPGFPLMTSNALKSWELQIQAIQRCVDEGHLAGDASIISHLIWFSLHGLVALENGKRLIFGHDARELTDVAIDAILSKYTPEQ